MGDELRTPRLYLLLFALLFFGMGLNLGGFLPERVDWLGHYLSGMAFGAILIHGLWLPGDQTEGRER